MRRKRIIKRSIWTLVIVFIFVNAVAFLHAHKFTHFDSSEIVKTKEAAHLSLSEKIKLAIFGINNPRPQNKTTPKDSFETIYLRSNRLIECWLIKTQNPKGTVVLFHGYGGEKSSMLDKADVFQSLGYNTLLVDFMGVGGSEGNQTTIGFKEAEQVKTCVQFLEQRGEKKIILFGTSMGAAAIMRALNSSPLLVNSIILECPFGTMIQTVKNRFATMGIPPFPMAHLLTFWGGVENGFNAFEHKPVDYAKNIKCPVLLFYGEKDQKVTRAETMEIFDHLVGPKKMVTFPEAAHENYLKKYREQWTQAISEFLSSNKKIHRLINDYPDFKKSMLSTCYFFKNNFPVWRNLLFL